MASWRDRSSEELTMGCPGGHSFGPVTAERIAADLKQADAQWREREGKEGSPFYAYGDRVSDPLALLMRYLTLLGWTRVTGSLTKMRCPEHRLEERNG